MTSTGHFRGVVPGEPMQSSIVGNYDHVMRRAEVNLQSTAFVLKDVGAAISREIATLQDHKRMLQLSLVRAKHGKTDNVKEQMAKSEYEYQLKDQIDSLTKMIDELSKQHGFINITANQTVDVTSDKNYNEPQSDEQAIIMKLETGEETLLIEKNGAPYQVPWKAGDPNSWVHYGWKQKDPSLWVDPLSVGSSGSSPSVPTDTKTLWVKVEALERKLAESTAGPSEQAE
ncbi:unnamed protein product [Prorocentrum cordatum]|uniref:Peroxin-14 n=1 Tax=Prorocentrum cordatum TaxID=2364126 RepID=A0ABN9U2U0_9DINO|nr:unnamed protein product [Polarella glacialis]CAK0852951.1 unnamed protein product [Polarella glacialis]